MKAKCANCGKEVELSAEAAEFISGSDSMVRVRPLCDECGERGYAEMELIFKINDRPEYVATRAIGG